LQVELDSTKTRYLEFVATTHGMSVCRDQRVLSSILDQIPGIMGWVVISHTSSVDGPQLALNAMEGKGPYRTISIPWQLEVFARREDRVARIFEAIQSLVNWHHD